MGNFSPDQINALERLINYTNTAEGSVLPPQLVGGVRIPSVTNLQVVKSTPAVGGTLFTLSWTDVEDGRDLVDHYDVSALGFLNNNTQPLNLTHSDGSPANVTVQADKLTPVIFIVQTILKNGMTSTLAQSPSCAAVCLAPTVTTQFINPTAALSRCLSISNFFNLVDNGNFDAGNNGAWTPVIAAATPLSPTSVPELPPAATVSGWVITNEAQGRVGAWAGKHTATANTNDLLANDAQIACNPGDQFVLTGYAKSSSAGTDGTMSLTVLFYDSNYAYNGTRVAGVISGGTTSYQQILFSVTAPANTITMRVFWQAQNHTTGVWYVDDTSCTAVQASTALNIGQLSIGPNGSLTISGFTWTANSPGAGSIAWSAGFLSYKGILYSIPAGNTASQFVYWQLSSPNSFQTTALPLPTLGVDDFIIAENNAGKYNVAFDMVRSDGARTVMIGDSFFIINSNGKLMADFDNGGGFGLLEVRDSTATVTIAAHGDTARIDFPTSGAPAAGKTLAGYIPVVRANGTDYYMAVYT